MDCLGFGRILNVGAGEPPVAALGGGEREVCRIFGGIYCS